MPWMLRDAGAPVSGPTHVNLSCLAGREYLTCRSHHVARVDHSGNEHVTGRFEHVVAANDIIVHNNIIVLNIIVYSVASLVSHPFCLTAE